VTRWIVTHHDPMHDDSFLETKLNLTRQILEEIGHPAQVLHGYDGNDMLFVRRESSQRACCCRRAADFTRIEERRPRGS